MIVLDPGDPPRIRQEIKALHPYVLFKRAFFKRTEGGISQMADTSKKKGFKMLPLFYPAANGYLSKGSSSIPKLHDRKIDVACTLRPKYSQSWRKLTFSAMKFFVFCL